MELPDDRLDVRIDVRMVVLDVVHDQRPRPVVDELGALVEKRGVVFVGFDDEIRIPAEPRGDAEVERHSTDQKAGLEPCTVQNPGQHARRGGLAVGSGDGQHPTVAQHVLGEPLGPRVIAHARVEHGFDDRRAAAEARCRPRRNRRDRAAACRRSPRAAQCRAARVACSSADRRSDRRPRRMPGRLGDGRDSAHERSADPEDVNTHQAGVGNSVRRRLIESRT